MVQGGDAGLIESPSGAKSGSRASAGIGRPGSPEPPNPSNPPETPPLGPPGSLCSNHTGGPPPGARPRLVTPTFENSCNVHAMKL